MISILAAVAAGIIMVWSLMGMLRHKLNEIAMGSAIVAKLCASEKRSVISLLLHPFLPLSKEAADLPESKSMMNSYWKSGLYYMVFLGSTIVLAVAYQSAFG